MAFPDLPGAAAIRLGASRLPTIEDIMRCDDAELEDCIFWTGQRHKKVGFRKRVDGGYWMVAADLAGRATMMSRWVLAASGAQVTSVIDSDTNEVIRQIPPAQILRIIQQVQEMQGRLMPGMFLDDHT